MIDTSIYCSCLPNDADMIRALGSVAVPIPIDFGDACFSGLGEKGKPIMISVERKHAGDLAQCIQTSRYLNQATVAREYGADVLVLVLEGRYRRNRDTGLLEIPVWIPFVREGKNHRHEEWQPVKPTMQFSRFTQYLLELQYLVGVLVFRTETVQDTADVIMSLHANFQKSPDEHHSLKNFYTTPQPKITLVRPNLVKRVAKEFDGIGWEKAGATADYFKSVSEMVNACEKDWVKIPGIGKKIAHSVVSSIKRT